MAAKRPVAIGMVGCGFYAQNHLNAWADLKPEGMILSAENSDGRLALVSPTKEVLPGSQVV